MKAAAGEDCFRGLKRCGSCSGDRWDLFSANLRAGCEVAALDSAHCEDCSLNLAFTEVGGIFSAPDFVESAGGRPIPPTNPSLALVELLNRFEPSLTGVPGEIAGDGRSAGVGDRAKVLGGEEEITMTVDIV